MGQTLIPRFIANTLRALRSAAPLRAVLVGLSLLLAFLSISPVSAATPVSGTLSEDTTWAATDSPYTVTGNVTVASSTTLTIEPGVTVKFDGGKALVIEGTLVARGTSTSTITFTSSALSPAAGDWGYIEFKTGSTGTTFDGDGDYVSGSIFEHCVVEYGGSYAESFAFLDVVLGAPYINSCTFTNNEGGNVGGVVGAYRWTGSGPNNGYDPVKITNSTFTQNDAVAIRNAQNATITSNTITYNKLGIEFDGGAITITDNVITNNTGSGQNAGGVLGSIDVQWGIFGSVVTISGNQISDNGNSGVHIIPYGNGTATISNNTIVRNSGASYGGGIRSRSSGGGAYGFTVYITNNYIADNSAGSGGGIYISHSSPVFNISYNRIHNNNATGGEGSALWIVDTSQVELRDTYEYNTVTGGTGTSLIFKYQGNPTIRYNNFVHKSETYLIYDDRHVGENATFDFENNWWGTTDTTNLDALIYDWNDNATKEQIDYAPFLTAPDTTAPPSPPSNVAAQTGPTTIALTWDANPEADIAGYKIHYDTDAAGYPYATSVDVGNVTSYTLTGLNTATTYYTAVSAYDADGTSHGSQAMRRPRPRAFPQPWSSRHNLRERQQGAALLRSQWL